MRLRVAQASEGTAVKLGVAVQHMHESGGVVNSSQKRVMPQQCHNPLQREEYDTKLS